MFLGRKINESEEDVSSAPGHPQVSSPGQGKGKEKGEQLAGKVLREPGYLSLPVLQSKGAISSTSQAQHGDSRVSLCPGRQRRQHLPTGRIRRGSQTLTPHLLQPGIPPAIRPKGAAPVSHSIPPLTPVVLPASASPSSLPGGGTQHVPPLSILCILLLLPLGWLQLLTQELHGKIARLRQQGPADNHFFGRVESVPHDERDTWGGTADHREGAAYPSAPISAMVNGNGKGS